MTQLLQLIEKAIPEAEGKKYRLTPETTSGMILLVMHLQDKIPDAEEIIDLVTNHDRLAPAEILALSRRVQEISDEFGLAVRCDIYVDGVEFSIIHAASGETIISAGCMEILGELHFYNAPGKIQK